MEFFSLLGARVARTWRARNFDEQAFSEIATQALVEAAPARHIAYADVIAALFFGDELPQQPENLSFGQPPITVYSHPRFYIDILCWMDGTTAIHQHRFSGAFHVMAGSSVHTRYEFQRRERIHEHLLIGDLHVAGCELLRAGDTRAIRAGSAFIHALFHLERPSISLVLRTRSEAAAGPQYTYFPPHLAVNPFEKNPLHEQRDLVTSMLLATDRDAFHRFVRKTVAEADFHSVYRLLHFAYKRAIETPHDVDPADVDALAAAARARFGERVDALLASFAETRRIRDIGRRRAEVIDADARFFLALLMNLPNRNEIYRLVVDRFGTEPSALVRRWLRELTRISPAGAVSLLDIELDGTVEGEGGANPIALLLHTMLDLMLDGAREGALLARLRDALPPGSLDDAADSVIALQEALLHGALRPLFVEQP